MPDQPKVEIREPSLNEMKAIFDLRWRDLYEPEGRRIDELRKESYPMDSNPKTIHIAAFIDDKPISSVRIEPHPRHGDYVSLMVTDMNWRKKGIGSKVLKAAESIAHKKFAIGLLKLHADVDAVKFYNENGYVKNSDDVLSKVGEKIIKYIGMQKDLSIKEK